MSSVWLVLTFPYLCSIILLYSMWQLCENMKIDLHQTEAGFHENQAKWTKRREKQIFFTFIFVHYLSFSGFILKPWSHRQEFIFWVKQTYLLDLNPYKEINVHLGSSGLWKCSYLDWFSSLRQLFPFQENYQLFFTFLSFCVPLKQGCQTRGPHQPHSCLQRAECNFRTV